MDFDALDIAGICLLIAIALSGALYTRNESKERELEEKRRIALCSSMCDKDQANCFKHFAGLDR